MFATGLFQAGKGVATASSLVTSRTAADFSFLHILPDITFTEVVVKGEPWLFQDQQQFGLISVKPLQGLPESRKTRARGTEFFETRLDVFFQFVIWRRLVRLQRMFPGGIAGFLRDNNGLGRFSATDVVTNNIASGIDIKVDKCY